MPSTHAVVALSHDSAQVLEFDTPHLLASGVRAYRNVAARHGGRAYSQHEFFGHVCDAIDAIGELLVTGTRTTLADFCRYAREHRPPTAARALGYEVVHRPTQDQLVGLARQFFVRVDVAQATDAEDVHIGSSMKQAPDLPHPTIGTHHEDLAPRRRQ